MQTLLLQTENSAQNSMNHKWYSLSCISQSEVLKEVTTMHPIVVPGVFSVVDSGQRSLEEPSP